MAKCSIRAQHEQSFGYINTAA